MAEELQNQETEANESEERPETFEPTPLPERISFDEDADLDLLVEELAGPQRRRRQEASHRIAMIAREDVTQALPYAKALIDALYRPEAQTRWEVLDALSEIAAVKPADCAKAYEGAEASLFDEGSSTVRLSAFRFLTRYGATTQKRSDQVWSILDEAVQCYHGDAEYRDMLACLLEFADGDISPETRAALVSRVSFDAQSSRGYVQTLSEQIVSASKERERELKKKAKGASKKEPAKKAPAKKKDAKK